MSAMIIQLSRKPICEQNRITLYDYNPIQASILPHRYAFVREVKPSFDSSATPRDLGQVWFHFTERFRDGFRIAANEESFNFRANFRMDYTQRVPMYERVVEHPHTGYTLDNPFPIFIDTGSAIYSLTQFVHTIAQPHCIYHIGNTLTFAMSDDVRGCI